MKLEDANVQLENFSKELFTQFLEMNPQSGSSLGLHEYDGKIPDVTKEAIEKDLNKMKALQIKLSEIEYDDLNPKNKFDHNISSWALSSGFFEIELMQGHKKNPMFYAFMFSDLHSYISRDYAPFEERLSSVIAIMNRIAATLKSAEENLDKELPEVLCKYAIQFSLGYENFFKGEMLDLIKAKVNDKKIIDQYINSSNNAVEAFKNYIKFLEGASSAKNESYRLGKEKFAKMLSIKEQINIPIEEIKRMGMEELERLQTELKVILKENNFEDKLANIEQDHPNEKNLIDETNRTLYELVEFIRSNNIVGIPEKLNCIITEMPKYMNFGFAAMGTAGPFEKSDESFYYVNLPENKWSEEKREEWMTQYNYPTLKLISIHEAYPGHYTHFLNANANSSDLAKLFMSYSYIEGWAHYTEEMMLDEGYAKKDFKVKIGQLIEALIRCCRLIVAIDIHCQKMPIEAAKNFFLKNAHMTETTALQEAERGAFDPGYLNYTLGKILLKKFKEKYFAKYRETKTLKDFHDTIVRLGAPTFRIAEEFVL
ncbi:MAG: DUF885 domain-containing protein [Ignavibacteria bacterium]